MSSIKKSSHVADQSGPTGRKSGLIPGMAGAVAALLIAGALLTWWTVQRTDRGMRQDLLQQARLTAKSLNMENVKSLSGSDVDLKNPAYLRLKQQFAAVRQAGDKYRFVYLAGRKPSGEVFIFVDNEPPASKDYSPPGDVYAEAADSFHRVFRGGTPVVEGPVSDRWGTWVSALVPLFDPHQAVYGVALPADAKAMVKGRRNFIVPAGGSAFWKRWRNRTGCSIRETSMLSRMIRR